MVVFYPGRRMLRENGPIVPYAELDAGQMMLAAPRLRPRG